MLGTIERESVKSYVKDKYEGYLLSPKIGGNSEGFVLQEGPSPSSKRIYFKSDKGYLADHFAFSIFVRVAVKASESKIHYIKDEMRNPFYLSTNGMNRSYSKNDALKSKTFMHDCDTQLTADQIEQFRASLAKLRLLAYVFGLTDLKHDNIGYLKTFFKGLTTFKLGVIDFITPITWHTGLRDKFNDEIINKALLVGMFSQAHLVTALNNQIGKAHLPNETEWHKIKLTLNEYQRALESISNPSIREFDDNGYLVSKSPKEKTKFELVVERVFSDLQKECSAFDSIDKTSRKNLSNYLGKVKKYKNVIKCRFQDVEAIINGRGFYRFINILIKEIVAPWIGLILCLRVFMPSIESVLLSLVLFPIYWVITQNHFITNPYVTRFLSC